MVYICSQIINKLQTGGSMEEMKDKSDIKNVLVNIVAMFQCYVNTVNEFSRHLLGYAMALEAHALANKLHFAAARWQYKLPFKEARDVNFPEWIGKVKDMLSWFVNTDEAGKKSGTRQFQPSTRYFIDYLEMDETAGKNTPFYKINDAEKSYMVESALMQMLNQRSNLRKLRKDIDWNDVFALLLQAEGNTDGGKMRHINGETFKKTAQKQTTVQMYEWIKQVDVMHYYSHKYIKVAFTDLLNALEQVDNVLDSPGDEQYKALYERIVAAYFKEHVAKAKKTCREFMNRAPVGNRLKKLKQKLEKEKGQFYSGKWTDALKDYFEVDNPDSDHHKINAAKFMFKYRDELTKEELGQIITQYNKQLCLQREINRKENSGNKPSRPKNEKREEKILGLPTIFVSELRNSAKATNMLVGQIRQLEKTTSTRCRKISTSWGHVKEALCRAQLIGKKCKGSDFSSAIEMICPNRKACNVAQTLKTFNSREKDTDDESIINDMTEMFNQVKEAF